MHNMFNDSKDKKNEEQNNTINNKKTKKHHSQNNKDQKKNNRCHINTIISSNFKEVLDEYKGNDDYQPSCKNCSKEKGHM